MVDPVGTFGTLRTGNGLPPQNVCLGVVGQSPNGCRVDWNQSRFPQNIGRLQATILRGESIYFKMSDPHSLKGNVFWAVPDDLLRGLGET